MKCMAYSNEKHINIIPQEDFEELVHEVFDTIASNISLSLGPLGSSATIFDGAIVEATKDGYSILNKYSFHNIYKRMIYNLIKAPCTKMNNTVGDGTTTAIALTNAIYNRYKEHQNSISAYYRLPRQLTTAWDEVVSSLIERVKSKAKTIDPADYDTIYHIAYVTSNGNHEVSDAIASVYVSAKSPNIKMKDSPTNESFIKPITGFEFPANAIDNCYVRNQDLTATEKNVAVMIFDHTIETDTFNNLIIPINDVLRSQDRKLIIIAPAYDKYMCETVLGQYVNYEVQKYRQINLVLTQYLPDKLAPYQKEDLAVILQTKLITQDLANGIISKLQEAGSDITVENMRDENDKFARCIGFASQVLLSCKNGCIFEPDLIIADDKYYQEALYRANAELQDIIDHTDYEKQSFAAKVYEANARLMQLEMKNYIYYIGANSDLQKQILYASIEDVIKCLKSAIKYGVVPGCQLTIIQAIDEMVDEITAGKTTSDLTDDENLKIEILDIIICAVQDVYIRVLMGPRNDGILKTIPRWNYTTEEGADELKKEVIAKLKEIVTESVKTQQVFDLETLKYNDKIITSAETDAMVLTAATELIKILISGNQCIFLDPELNNVHQDTVDAYV